MNMKINNDAPRPVTTTSPGIKRSTDKVSITSKEGAPASDLSQIGTVEQGNVKVTLSDRAQDMMKAADIAASSPDVRPEKVKSLKELLNAGKYKIDTAGIADKMVEEHLKDIHH
jgi:flagellar biosynthesis anti-sigma factor FlgM